MTAGGSCGPLHFLPLHQAVVPRACPLLVAFCAFYQLSAHHTVHFLRVHGSRLKLMSGKPSKLPAWGGGSGARMASQAAAAKMRTAKDAKERCRSASAADYSEGAASSNNSGW